MTKKVNYMPIIDWIAYCVTCDKELERCPNGGFADGAARYHIRENQDHRVIVGYDLEYKNLETSNNGV